MLTRYLYMARYSNIMIGGLSSCNMNGRQISVIDGEGVIGFGDINNRY